MDANNPLNPQPQAAPEMPQTGLPIQTPPGGAAQPNLMVSPEQHPMPDNTEGKSSGKMVFFLVAGIVMAILAAGGIYLYLNNQKQTTETTTSQPAVVATPAPQAVTEADADSVEVVDVEAEFTDVNKDLQKL